MSSLRAMAMTVAARTVRCSENKDDVKRHLLA